MAPLAASSRRRSFTRRSSSLRRCHFDLPDAASASSLSPTPFKVPRLLPSTDDAGAPEAEEDLPPRCMAAAAAAVEDPVLLGDVLFSGDVALPLLEKTSRDVPDVDDVGFDEGR